MQLSHLHSLSFYVSTCLSVLLIIALCCSMLFRFAQLHLLVHFDLYRAVSTLFCTTIPINQHWFVSVIAVFPWSSLVHESLVLHTISCCFVKCPLCWSLSVFVAIHSSAASLKTQPPSLSLCVWSLLCSLGSWQCLSDEVGRLDMWRLAGRQQYYQTEKTDFSKLSPYLPSEKVSIVFNITFGAKCITFPCCWVIFNSITTQWCFFECQLIKKDIIAYTS